jgi:hypothetical protein
MASLSSKQYYRDRSTNKLLFLPVFLLLSSVFLLQIESKTALSEDIKVANVDHDIDDLIDTSPNKFAPGDSPIDVESKLPRKDRQQKPQEPESQPQPPKKPNGEPQAEEAGKNK